MYRISWSGCSVLARIFTIKRCLLATFLVAFFVTLYYRVVLSQLITVLNISKECSQTVNTQTQSLPQDYQNCDHYMTACLFSDYRGLGNMMFSYAALLAMTEVCPNLCPYLLTKEAEVFKQAFESLSAPTRDEMIADSQLVNLEEFPRRYAKPTRSIMFNCSTNSHLTHYYQSWRYFHPSLSSRLKQREFRFSDNILCRARSHLRNIIMELNLNFSKVTTVGIHARMFGPEIGLLASSVEEIQRGIMKVREDLQKDLKTRNLDVVYVVISDVLPGHWHNKLLPEVGNLGFREYIDYRFALYRSVDMAILTQCDRIIMSASGSTFGWWSGYLSKSGIVYYNSKFAIKGSYMENATNPKEYFLDTWISY